MTRSLSLLTVMACLLGVAGCGSSHTGSTSAGATPRASTGTSSTTAAPTGAGVIASQHAVVSQFAAAYVRFLDGTGTASGLPDATASVRALAGRAGSIAAARRRGTLVMTQLRQAAGENNSYLLTARDDAHALYAQMTLVEQHDRWLVAQLTPPDFVQVFAPAGPPPPAPPHGSAGAQDAARLFLRNYLPWLYGQAPLRTVRTASAGLLAGFKAHPPRVPPTMQALRPTIAAIAMQRHGRRWQAAREHQRRARDLRARADGRAHARALACQQRQLPAMSTRSSARLSSSSAASTRTTREHMSKGGR